MKIILCIVVDNRKCEMEAAQINKMSRRSNVKTKPPATNAPTRSCTSPNLDCNIFVIQWRPFSVPRNSAQDSFLQDPSFLARSLHTSHRNTIAPEAASHVPLKFGDEADQPAEPNDPGGLEAVKLPGGQQRTPVGHHLQEVWPCSPVARRGTTEGGWEFPTELL